MSNFDSAASQHDDTELEGRHCDACGEWLEPGREWCPTCGMDR